MQSQLIEAIRTYSGAPSELKKHKKEEGALEERVDRQAELLSQPGQFGEKKLRKSVSKLSKNNLPTIKSCLETAGKWIEERKFKEASAEYQKGVELMDEVSSFPQEVKLQLLSHYARNLHRMKEWEKAKQFFETALKLPEGCKDIFTLSRYALFLKDSALFTKEAETKLAQETFDREKGEEKFFTKNSGSSDQKFSAAVKSIEEKYKQTLKEAKKRCKTALLLPTGKQEKGVVNEGMKDLFAVNCYASILELLLIHKKAARFYQYSLELCEEKQRNGILKNFAACALNHCKDLSDLVEKEKYLYNFLYVTGEQTFHRDLLQEYRKILLQQGKIEEAEDCLEHLKQWELRRKGAKGDPIVL